MYHRCAAAAALLLSAALAGQVQAQAPQPDVSPAQQSPPPDPEAAAEKVREALRADGEAGANVVVSTHADTIVLTGEVSGEVEGARTLSLAEQAAGGLRVSEQLQVRPVAGEDAERRSQALVRDIEGALRQDGRTANLGVSVSIDEQQVIGLHGMVPSRESRQAVESVAARVAGANRIRSHLVVPGE